MTQSPLVLPAEPVRFLEHLKLRMSAHDVAYYNALLSLARLAIEDAARYRWLRVNPVECSNLADNQTYRRNKDKPEIFDAAIDARRKPE